MKNRTAIYLRVSTDGQTVENQRLDLDKYAELRGWPIVASYCDEGISGTKGRDKRPGLKQLIDDGKKRRFDRLLCWSVDRLGRSTAVVTSAMEELSQAGIVQFYFKESMDSSTPHGAAMLEMAAVFAKLERGMIVERVRAGLARARSEGKKLGRPSAVVRALKGKKVDINTPAGRAKLEAMTAAKEREARRLLAKNVGVLKVAKKLGLGTGTVQNIKTVMAAAS
jgi:DNA invertase Pin-like site-specific DNA recombinase